MKIYLQLTLEQVASEEVLEALCLEDLDAEMDRLGLFFARSMDDWVMLAKSRWKLRRTRLELLAMPDTLFRFMAPQLHRARYHLPGGHSMAKGCKPSGLRKFLKTKAGRSGWHPLRPQPISSEQGGNDNGKPLGGERTHGET